MKSAQQVDALMARLPEQWRGRWCGAENGACACLGCVQIGCRAIMAEELRGHRYIGDPEHIDESQIPEALRSQFRPTREEWEEWRKRVS